MAQTQSLTMKPCTRIWMLLLALTGLTFAAGQFGPDRGLGSGGMALLVLGLAAFKALLVADHFMGLRRVSGFWRPLIIVYLILLTAGIGLAFFLSA